MREKKELIALKNGKKILFTSIDKFDESEKKKYAGVLTEISKMAGQDPGDHVFDWLEVADSIIIVKSENNNIAFSVICIPENNVLHIAATMVIPEYQNSGVGVLLTKKAIKHFYFNKIKNSFIELFKIWKPIYILFRTQNPSIYLRFSKKKIPVYPSTEKNNKPKEEIINIASRISKKLWPYADFNPKNFVLKNAYKLHPFLIIKPKDIPWSRNEKIDFLFQSSLGLDKESKDALILIVEIIPPYLLKR